MEALIVKFILELPELIIKTVNITSLKDALKTAGQIIDHLKSRESELTQMVETFRQKYLKSEKDNAELKQENSELKEETARLKGV
jgi:cell shape-determining protein MreC